MGALDGLALAVVLIVAVNFLGWLRDRITGKDRRKSRQINRR
jgi:hypothetical protein